MYSWTARLKISMVSYLVSMGNVSRILNRAFGLRAQLMILEFARDPLDRLARSRVGTQVQVVSNSETLCTIHPMDPSTDNVSCTLLTCMISPILFEE